MKKIKREPLNLNCVSMHVTIEKKEIKKTLKINKKLL